MSRSDAWRVSSATAVVCCVQTFTVVVFAQSMLLERIPCGPHVAEGGIAAVGDAGAFAVAANPAMLAAQRYRMVLDTGSLWYFAGSGMLQVAAAVRESRGRLVAGTAAGWFDSGEFGITDLEGRLTGARARYTATILLLGVGFSPARHLKLGAGIYTVTDNPGGMQSGARLGAVYSPEMRTAFLDGFVAGATVNGIGQGNGAAYELGVGVEVPRTGRISVGVSLYGSPREPARCSIGYRRMLLDDVRLRRSFVLQAGVDGINLLGIGGAPSVGFLAGYREFVVGYAAIAHLPLGFVHQLSAGARW